MLNRPNDLYHFMSNTFRTYWIITKWSMCKSACMCIDTILLNIRIVLSLPLVLYFAGFVSIESSQTICFGIRFVMSKVYKNVTGIMSQFGQLTTRQIKGNRKNWWEDERESTEKEILRIHREILYKSIKTHIDLRLGEKKQAIKGRERNEMHNAACIV